MVDVSSQDLEFGPCLIHEIQEGKKLVVFEPERRETISASTHHSRCDYSLYEGTEIVGAPEHVLLRGSVLVEDGELVGTPGMGRFVRRARFGEQLQTDAAVRS